MIRIVGLLVMGMGVFVGEALDGDFAAWLLVVVGLVILVFPAGAKRVEGVVTSEVAGAVKRQKEKQAHEDLIRYKSLLEEGVLSGDEYEAKVEEVKGRLSQLR